MAAGYLSLLFIYKTIGGSLAICLHGRLRFTYGLYVGTHHTGGASELIPVKRDGRVAQRLHCDNCSQIYIYNVVVC
jgi:hypothetical protein